MQQFKKNKTGILGQAFGPCSIGTDEIATVALKSKMMRIVPNDLKFQKTVVTPRPLRLIRLRVSQIISRVIKIIDQNVLMRSRVR